MIGVIARNYVRLEQMDEFIKIASALVEETRKEAGCTIYTVFRNVENETLTFMEIWDDKQSLNLHLKSDHFIKYAGMLETLQYEKTKLEIFDDRCL